MLIGILSDTHGRFEAARQGIQVLREQGAEFLIHCGDVGEEDIIDLLAGQPAAFVFGNNDFDRAGMARYADSLGVQCLGQSGTLELAGRQIAVTHGDDASAVKRILDQKQHDYLLLGHSHVAADRRIGRTRLINPGALYRASVKTVALLDTTTDRLRFLTVRV